MSEDKLQHLIDEVLLDEAKTRRRGSRWTPGDVIGDIVTKAGQEGIQPNVRVILEYFSQLVRLGVVAVAPSDMAAAHPRYHSGGNSSTIQIPAMIVTDHGLKLLEHKETSPHNRTRYLESIRTRITSPDPVILVYVEEAIGAWQAGLYRSCAVMTGCACERLIHRLASAVVDSKHVPWSERLGKMGKKAPAGISDVFGEVRDALQDLASNKKLPDDLGDALDRKLSPIFEHVRILRNQAGHPTGEEVSAEDAEAGLLMFPGFYSYADRLIEKLRTLPP